MPHQAKHLDDGGANQRQGDRYTAGTSLDGYCPRVASHNVSYTWGASFIGQQRFRPHQVQHPDDGGADQRLGGRQHRVGGAAARLAPGAGPRRRRRLHQLRRERPKQADVNAPRL